MVQTYSSLLANTSASSSYPNRWHWAFIGMATAMVTLCTMLTMDAMLQSYAVASSTSTTVTVVPLYPRVRALGEGATPITEVHAQMNDNMPLSPDIYHQTSQWTTAAFVAVPVALLAAALMWYRRREDSQVALLPYSGIRSPALPQPKSSRVILYGKNKNDNFIDQTFTVIADQLLKFLPTTKREKKAFMYYRDGMSAQGTGDYAEALQNYYEALKLETDPFDRSYILYNIGLIHASNGELDKALEYYYQALERNPNLPSALNNIAVIYHFQGEVAEQEGRLEDSIELFDKAADYWREAIRLAPTNYMEAQNWLQSRGELSPDRPY